MWADAEWSVGVSHETELTLSTTTTETPMNQSASTQYQIKHIPGVTFKTKEHICVVYHKAQHIRS